MNTLNIYKVKDMNIQKTTAYVRFLILLTRDKNETSGISVPGYSQPFTLVIV